MNLHDYDIVVINTSGGKDSVCAMHEICQLADMQLYPKSNLYASHQDLGESEWPGTTDLVRQQCRHFGIELHISKRRDQHGRHESLLEYVKRRGKWPSNKQRWCTSDFKRGPGQRVITSLTKGLNQIRVLQVFGFRSEESPARSKKEVFIFNKRASSRARKVFDYLPIHNWTEEKVWNTIHENQLPYHRAYDLGMPRLSCMFCIFSPFDALVIAGRENPEMLDKYIEAEDFTGHTFRDGFSLKEIRQAIDEGYTPKKVSNWVM